MAGHLEPSAQEVALAALVSYLVCRAEPGDEEESDFPFSFVLK